MSAQNFYNKNASKIYAFEAEEDYEYEDVKSNMFYEVEKQAKEKKIDFYKLNKCDNDRNYGGVQFFELIVADKYILTGVVRSGYYAGGNFDFELEAYDEDGYKQEFEGDIPGELQAVIDRVEKIYAEYTTPLYRVGVFSNGEAVYELAK